MATPNKLTNIEIEDAFFEAFPGNDFHYELMTFARLIEQLVHAKQIKPKPTGPTTI